MRSPRPLPLLLPAIAGLFGLLPACGAGEPPAVAPPAPAPTVAPAPPPAASAASGDHASDARALALDCFGVRTTLAEGWTVKRDGWRTVALAPGGQSGLVLFGVRDPGQLPRYTRLAEETFHVTLPLPGGGPWQSPAGVKLMRKEVELATTDAKKARAAMLVGAAPGVPGGAVGVLAVVREGDAVAAQGLTQALDALAPVPVDALRCAASEASAASAVASAPPVTAERMEIPAPFSEADRKELATKCKPLEKALESAADKVGGGAVYGPWLALQDVRKSPPAMPEAQQKRCLDLADRRARGYLVDSLGVDAKVHLENMGRGMTYAVEDTGKPCPSSAAPLPRDFSALAAGPTRPPPSAWDDEPWSCLHMRPETTQLQLEVHTDAQAGTFLLLARAMPLRDGRMVEWTLEGKVTGKTVTLGKVQRR